MDPTGPVLYFFSRAWSFARQTVPAGLLQQLAVNGIEEWPYDDRDEDYNPDAGKDDMQEDETMSSEASEEESHSASGGVGVDEEVSDSSNNNTMREEDRSRLKAPTQPFPPLLYINIPYSQVFFQFLPHVIS